MFFGRRGSKLNQECEDYNYVCCLKQLNVLFYHRNQYNCLAFKVDYAI